MLDARARVRATRGRLNVALRALDQELIARGSGPYYVGSHLVPWFDVPDCRAILTERNDEARQANEAWRAELSHAAGGKHHAPHKPSETLRRKLAEARVRVRAAAMMYEAARELYEQALAEYEGRA